MYLTQKKNQYALRAIYELAKQAGKGPIKVSEIARAQAIPHRFLEVILNKLKGSGFVESKRGFYGGYTLTCQPDKITVGDVLRYMEGYAEKVSCMGCESNGSCPFHGDCVFMPLWNRVRDAIFDIYDKTTIMDLLCAEEQNC